MKTVTIGALALIFLAIPSSPDEKKSFRELQWKYPRVRTAAKEKNEVLEKWFREKGVAFPPGAILLRAFKKEALLELWAADAEKKDYVLVHEYRICTSSGTRGAKRRFGDEQVPEGFYDLDWFNSQSNFYLSLHINYPNASDRILGSHQNPGGDIFLHGNCASIGCIPITDDGIKEVYWLAVLVQNEGQRHSPIHIFPDRLTDDGFKALAATHQNEPVLLSFWRNLKQGYDLFEKNHRLPRIGTGPMAPMFFPTGSRRLQSIHPLCVRRRPSHATKVLHISLQKRHTPAHCYDSQAQKTRSAESLMKRVCYFPAVMLLCIYSGTAYAAQTQAPSSASNPQQAQPAASAPSAPAPSTAAQQTPPQRITAYTLPPDRYKKAHDLGRIYFRFTLVSFFYGLVALWLVLRWKLAPKYRTLAENLSSKRFVQALVFAPLLILTIDLLELPTNIYQHWLSRNYGISIQAWPSWLWDWTKGEIISVIISSLLIWILYAIIRKSTRRWWFYFWLASLPIGLLLIFVQPVIIDPLFHKFEPLAQKDLPLTAALQKLVQRAGQDIPPERMYWMGAGEKTTALNAYVAGFGASKRIVVWDTTIAKMNTPQIVFVTGHEMGHYVLGHIPKLLAFAAALLFVFFYLGYRGIGWMLSRWGQNWEIRGIEDWASLPALLILLSILFFLASPLISAGIRHQEHQADQYGLEVTHGLTPDSGQIAAQAFQVLGDVDLADPDPDEIDIFLFYSHPAIRDRVQFSLTYDPWSKGGQGEFVK